MNERVTPQLTISGQGNIGHDQTEYAIGASAFPIYTGAFANQKTDTLMARSFARASTVTRVMVLTLPVYVPNLTPKTPGSITLWPDPALLHGAELQAANTVSSAAASATSVLLASVQPPRCRTTRR